MSCLPQILDWTAVSATVGVILRVIESRSERFEEIVSGLLGMAWTIATYFVVPILVVERVGPIRASRRSMSSMRRTWGEALTANFGIGIITFLATLIALIPLIGGFFVWAHPLVCLGHHAAAAGRFGFLRRGCDLNRIVVPLCRRRYGTAAIRRSPAASSFCESLVCIQAVFVAAAQHKMLVLYELGHIGLA